MAAVTVAGMFAAAFLGLRPVLFRKTATILIVGPSRSPEPVWQGIEEGVALALEENGSRAEGIRLMTESKMSFLASADYAEERGVVLVIGATWVSDEGRFWEKRTAILSAADATPWRDRPGFGDPELELPINLFHIMPSDPPSRLAVDWAARAGIRRVAAVHERSYEQAHQLAAEFARNARAAGLESSGPFAIEPDPPGSPHEILASNPELIFCAGENPRPGDLMPRLLAELRASGYAGKLMLAELHPDGSQLHAPQKWPEGTYLVTPFAPTPPEFRQKFIVRQGHEPPTSAWYGYQAGRLAIRAIEQAGTNRNADVLRALSSFPEFDERGETTANRPSLYRLKGGRFEFVERLP